MVVDRSIRHLEHSHILLNIMELDILGQTHSLSRKSTCKSALSTHTEREIDKIYSNGLRSMSQKSMRVRDEKLICNTYSGLSVASMVNTQQRQYAVCVHRRVRVRVRIASLIVCYCRYVASSKGTCIYVSRLNAITVSMLICKIIIHTHTKKI